MNDTTYTELIVCTAENSNIIVGQNQVSNVFLEGLNNNNLMCLDIVLNLIGITCELCPYTAYAIWTVNNVWKFGYDGDELYFVKFNSIVCGDGTWIDNDEEFEMRIELSDTKDGWIYKLFDDNGKQKAMGGWYRTKNEAFTKATETIKEWRD